MKWLLDTNILSELNKPRPHELLMRWISRLDPATAYISAVTIGEMRRGIEMKRKRQPEAVFRLENALENAKDFYLNRILAFDQKAAHIWGRITIYHPNNSLDMQIAAIALAHDAILVTRNVKDFKASGAQLFNPFEP